MDCLDDTEMLPPIRDAAEEIAILLLRQRRVNVYEIADEGILWVLKSICAELKAK